MTVGRRHIKVKTSKLCCPQIRTSDNVIVGLGEFLMYSASEDVVELAFGVVLHAVPAVVRFVLVIRTQSIEQPVAVVGFEYLLTYAIFDAVAQTFVHVFELRREVGGSNTLILEYLILVSESDLARHE